MLVTGAPGKSQESINTTLTVSRQNFVKDIYIIDLDGHEKRYWLVTESGLLGVFHFDGTCTSGVSHTLWVRTFVIKDNRVVYRATSSPSPSQRAAGFALISGGSRRRGHDLESPRVSSPVRILRSSPRPRESAVLDRQ